MIVFTHKHMVKVVATGENDGFTNRILKFSGVEVGTGWQNGVLTNHHQDHQV
jgi:hypothetical protein